LATAPTREKIFLQEPELKLSSSLYGLRRTPYALIFLISLAAGALGGFAAGFFFAPKPHARADAEGPVETMREWVLRDNKGKPQGILGLNNGRWTFSWGAPGRDSKLMLETSEQGTPVLQLIDSAGHARVLLGGLPGGSEGLRISEAQGSEGLDLSVSPDGNPVLRMNQEEQGARVKLGISSDGTKGLFFYRDQDDPDAVFMQAGNEPPVVGTPEAHYQKRLPSLNEAVRTAQQKAAPQKIETIRGIFSDTVEHCESGVMC